jgi:hypothetical protein
LRTHDFEKLLLSIMQFNDIIRPLDVDEWTLLVRMLLRKAPDLIMDDFLNTVALSLTAFRTTKGMPGISGPVLMAVYNKIMLHMPGMLQDVPSSVMPEVDVAVRPQVEMCLVCGSQLRTQLVPRKPWFYPSSGVPCKGSLYVKKCSIRGCGTEHRVGGYTRKHTLNQPTTLYSRENAHPRWFYHSRETIIDRRLFLRYEEDFHHNQATFRGFVDTYNHLENLGGSFLATVSAGTGTVGSRL